VAGEAGEVTPFEFALELWESTEYFSNSTPSSILTSISFSLS